MLLSVKVTLKVISMWQKTDAKQIKCILKLKPQLCTHPVFVQLLTMLQNFHKHRSILCNVFVNWKNHVTMQSLY